jgi:hypothetical protein
VGVVGNSAVIFSIIIEVVLGHGFPDLLTLLGMGLIVWAGYAVSRRGK